MYFQGNYSPINQRLYSSHADNDMVSMGNKSFELMILSPNNNPPTVIG
jgi:hypothetical protein